MGKEQDHAAKAHLVACMQVGQSWQQATASAGLQMSQSNAYRLWLAVRKRGETALADGRHGHPSKLRGAARSFLEEQCRQTLPLPSSALQAALRERFDLQVSVSQINRVRAALGVRNQAQPAGPEKKQKPPGLLRPT
jgi:transposase